MPKKGQDGKKFTSEQEKAREKERQRWKELRDKNDAKLKLFRKIHEDKVIECRKNPPNNFIHLTDTEKEQLKIKWQGFSEIYGWKDEGDEWYYI